MTLYNTQNHDNNSENMLIIIIKVEISFKAYTNIVILFKNNKSTFV